MTKTLKPHKQVWRKNACPGCGSQWVWLKGWQPAIGGPKRRLLCAECGITYHPNVEQPGWKKLPEKK